jgi:acyl carrier protein
MDKEKIISVLTKVKPSIETNLDKEFVTEGILDSLDIMNLIIELEETFEIEIDPGDVLSENFESVDAISTLIAKCKE